MPREVWNRVKVNMLVTIIGILIGGRICGVPGMFLTTPELTVIEAFYASNRQKIP
jgi:predicted PurR-regulated permease PerM